MVDSRFKKALVAVGGAALLTASALPVAAQDEGPLLYVINKSADQQYFIDLQNSFVAKAEELGGSALKADAKLDPSLGVQLVNDAISAGAAGIAITVPDQTIGPAISDAAAAAGVALVATDDGIVDSAGNPVPFVGFSGPDMGGKVGAEAARLLTEGGWLEDESVNLGVLSTEVQTLSVCEDRTNASKQAMLDVGVSADAIFQVPYTGETQSAQDAAGPVITAHPDVTHWVVFACNDEGVLGTLERTCHAGREPRQHPRRRARRLRGLQVLGRRSALRLQGRAVHLRPGRRCCRRAGAVRQHRQRRRAARVHRGPHDHRDAGHVRRRVRRDLAGQLLAVVQP